LKNSIDAAVIRVLLFEANPVDANTFTDWLSAAKSPAFDVHRESGFEPALAIAGTVDAILLGMPMLDVENLPRISRMREEAPAVPLIVLLGHAKEVAMLEALRLGAQDLLIKAELDEKALRRRIRFAITRKHDERLHRLLGAGADADGLPEEALDIGDAIGSACLMLQGYAATQKVRMQVDIAAGLPRLTSDRDRLRQILINLVSNAIRFTPSAGKVTVSATCNASGEIAICVADTGVGMSESQLELIGSNSGGADREIGQPSGRGLPLTEYLVRQHGASIKAEATPGGGTAFTVAFPAERAVLDR